MGFGGCQTAVDAGFYDGGMVSDTFIHGLKSVLQSIDNEGFRI